MAYDRDDRFRGNNERWQDRDSRPNQNSPYGERNLGRGYGSGYQSRNRDDDRRWRGDWDRDDDERGFFERAGETVRSWFSDDDDDQRRGDRRGGERASGGWGNQRGRGDDREERFGDFTSAGGGSDSFGEDIGGGRSNEIFGGPGYGGTSGFGGGSDHGRRFDRIDAGSTGTHGAHPMSSPVGGAYGGGYGVSSGGSFGSSAARYGGGQGSGSRAGQGRGPGGGIHDPNYAEWRRRQIDELDRDYDEYRREHQSKFEQEFGGWREKRQGQRRSLGRVTEHMEVIGSDGQHIGTVDKVRGDRIILTKNDQSAGGRHHSIPCSWIESVDDKVKVNKSAQEAMSAWRDEERNRALFEREDQGSGGPHMLNRSFSGTYSDE